MEITAYQSYVQFKTELDNEIKREAEGFVRIGYLLRVAKDTNVLSESGYSNVNDFAKAEYGLDASQVSRFMAINERFSQNGYAPELDLQYQGFGVAKLAIMLQLPDSVNEQLTPDLSKADINAIKEEVKEEQKISDIEVMLEPKSEDPLLKQMIDRILHDHPDIYEEIWEENKKASNFNLKCSTRDYADDILAAAGEAIYTTRVEGVGKLMLTIRAGKEKLIITNMRTGETQEPEWDELGRILWFQPTWRNAELEWVDKYQEEWPIKTQIPEKKEEKKPAKVITTPKKEEKKVEKAWGVGEKVAQSPISTQCEDNSGTTEDKEQMQQAEEIKEAGKLIKAEFEDYINKPVEDMAIEPVEEEIEEIIEDIQEIAPVQMAESLDSTQCATISDDNATHLGEFISEGLRQGIENAPIVETKTILQLKDDVVRKLGEVIRHVYDSNWIDAQNALEDADFMMKGIMAEEAEREKQDREEDEEE